MPSAGLSRSLRWRTRERKRPAARQRTADRDRHSHSALLVRYAVRWHRTRLRRSVIEETVVVHKSLSLSGGAITMRGAIGAMSGASNSVGMNARTSRARLAGSQFIGEMVVMLTFTQMRNADLDDVERIGQLPRVDLSSLVRMCHSVLFGCVLDVRLRVLRPPGGTAGGANHLNAATATPVASDSPDMARAL